LKELIVNVNAVAHKKYYIRPTVSELPYFISATNQKETQGDHYCIAL